MKLLDNSRPNWDEYFLTLAKTASLRADCRRAKHGAVLVKDNRVISMGYNGSEPNGPSCLAGECPRGLKTRSELPGYLDGNNDYSDCISLHAEVNCVVYADGDKSRGATIYVTGKPCDGCSKVIKAAGIKRVVYEGGEYLNG